LTLRGALQLQPGEERRALSLWAIGLLYAIATGVGESVAQSIFIARLDAARLAQMILVKGIFDVAASALYLPLTRGKSSARVLELALAIYAGTILLGRLALFEPGALPAYALSIGHECAWTILTIHWGVYILDVFDAEAARRLFPVVFTASCAGRLIGGAALQQLARPFGAANLLFLAAGAAVLGIVIAARTRRTDHHTEVEDSPTADTLRAASLTRLRAALVVSWSSPLVRAIAWSTALMVFAREGLRILGLDVVSSSYARDADRMAAFLGTYAVIANLAAIGLGLFVTPRILRRAGIGVVNVGYAVAATVAYGTILLVPSLGAAVAARFVQTELKDAVKTPLSALFYGAERPDRRAHARAFVFGVVIPISTVVTSIVFQTATSYGGIRMLVGVGLAAAVAFVAASAWQQRAWRARLAELLAWKLERRPVEGAAPLPDDLLHDDRPAVTLAWQGLHSEDARTRSVAAEVLAENVPRRVALRLAKIRRFQ
jgi:hypothetical protein